MFHDSHNVRLMHICYQVFWKTTCTRVWAFVCVQQSRVEEKNVLCQADATTLSRWGFVVQIQYREWSNGVKTLGLTFIAIPSTRGVLALLPCWRHCMKSKLNYTSQVRTHDLIFDRIWQCRHLCAAVSVKTLLLENLLVACVFSGKCLMLLLISVSIILF
jgi:hypothetical protein